MQSAILDPQGSVLPAERRQLLQERSGIRSRRHRRGLGRPRQYHPAHAAVVARGGVWGKPTARRLKAGLNAYETLNPARAN